MPPFFVAPSASRVPLPGWASAQSRLDPAGGSAAAEVVAADDGAAGVEVATTDVLADVGEVNGDEPDGFDEQAARVPAAASMIMAIR